MKANAKLPAFTLHPDGTWRFGKQVLHQCVHCDIISPVVKLTESCTAYHWNGTGKDPNRNMFRCSECDEAYRQYWEAMWDEYNLSMR